MAASSDPTKKTAKPRAAATKPRPRSKKSEGAESPDIGAAGDDADLRTRIARRAYEISQDGSAGDDAENWLRAEREVRGT